jgi:RsiW-degrading membrane proteinase PrsW (M82 family)
VTNLIFLIFLAILPGVAIAAFLYKRDIYEKEPPGQLIKAFFLGGLSVVLAAAIELALGKGSPLVEAFIYISFTEEFFKFLILVIVFYPKPQFNEPYDGIVYAGFISLGFATLENLFYVVDKGFAVAVVRMFLSVPAHAIFGVVMGFFVGGAKFFRGKRVTFLGLGLLSAVFLHGLYDYFLMAGIPLLVTFSLAMVIIGVILSLKAIRFRELESPFKPGAHPLGSVAAASAVPPASAAPGAAASGPGIDPPRT